MIKIVRLEKFDSSGWIKLYWEDKEVSFVHSPRLSIEDYARRLGLTMAGKNNAVLVIK